MGRRFEVGRKYGIYPERALYYLSKMYAGQLESGREYHTLKPVIGIHFLDYEQFPAHMTWQWAFELRDARHPAVRLTDHLRLHLVELPKFERESHVQGWGKSLFEWLHFLNHAHEEGEDAMQTQYQNPAIRQAFRKLQQLSANEETRQRAEIRERALKDEVSLLSEARDEGREEGREEGIKTGELIGSIRTLQRILRRSVSEETALRRYEPERLQQMLQELETDLNDSALTS